MNDAEVIAEVRRILDQRWPADQTIQAIKNVVPPAHADSPAELDSRRWPVLRGAAWERHDDPEEGW